MLATEKCQQQCYNEMEWGGGRTTDNIRVNKEYENNKAKAEAKATATAEEKQT